jgi:alkylation response protein AidB-like acyl-CoA dehydrogenase
VRRFVRRELWLWEKRIDANAFALPPEVAADLRPKAAAMGLAPLREPASLGGPSVDGATRALVLEEIAQHRAGVLAPGYGLFGPQVPPSLYAAAPGQRERFLLPLLRGERRCFIGLHDPWLGDPAGAGATAGLRIRARRTPDGWLLDGTKLFVAGAGREGDPGAADFGVVHARAEDEAGRPLGAACFLVETDHPGFQRWRPYPTMAAGRDTQELNLSNLRLPPESRIGEGPLLAPTAHARHDAYLAAQLTGVGRAACSMLRERARGDASDAARRALADADAALHAAGALAREAAATAVGADDATFTAATAATAAAARLAAQQAAEQVVDATIEAIGPAALSADLPLERWFRELRVLRESDGGIARLRGMAAR